MTVLFHLCLCVMLLVDTCCEELCFDVRCFALFCLAGPSLLARESLLHCV